MRKQGTEIPCFFFVKIWKFENNVVSLYQKQGGTKMKTIYDINHYVWAVFTAEETISSFEKDALKKYFKKLKITCEICRYKNGALSEIIDSKFEGEYHKDMRIITERELDFCSGSPQYKVKHLYVINGNLIIK